MRNARWERSWNVLHICNLHATRKLDLMSPELRRKRTLQSTCLDILVATGSSAASHFKSNIHNFFLSIFPASFLRENEKWRLFVLLVDHFFDRESFSKSFMRLYFCVLIKHPNSAHSISAYSISAHSNSEQGISAHLINGYSISAHSNSEKTISAHLIKYIHIWLVRIQLVRTYSH